MQKNNKSLPGPSRNLQNSSRKHQRCSRNSQNNFKTFYAAPPNGTGEQQHQRLIKSIRKLTKAYQDPPGISRTHLGSTRDALGTSRKHQRCSRNSQNNFKTFYAAPPNGTGEQQHQRLIKSIRKLTKAYQDPPGISRTHLGSTRDALGTRKTTTTLKLFMLRPPTAPANSSTKDSPNPSKTNKSLPGPTRNLQNASRMHQRCSRNSQNNF